ncbi:MAG TPA: tetratricopeptide repeat protein, partial [Chthoniobacterales bacterium]|nr:tetratricopeptide repeat protein [Chthoniobacterales bacterium]
RAELSPQLEPAFYTIGSAYFNAGEYAKAIAAFKNYQAKFPSGPHISDVKFGIAQASLGSKNYADAAKQFSAFESDRRLREQALLFQATAWRQAVKIDQAIVPLEKLASDDLKTASGARGLTMLAQLYADKGEADKVVHAISTLHEQRELVDNIVELNATTVAIGDQLFAKKLWEQALECYRAAYPRDQVVRMQNERVARMQRAVEANLAAALSDPSQIAHLGTANSQLKSDIAKAQQLLADFQKLPDFTPAIYIRMARSFYEADRKWETVVVYQELLDRFRSAPERESALFGIIVALAEVNQPAKAMARGEEYLRDFRTAPNAEAVSYLSGAAALQANDAAAAERYFATMLQDNPKSAYREQIAYLLGNAKFMAGKYDDATAEYKKYLTDFPKGESTEEVVYRLALTKLFAGKYEEAMKDLGAYAQKYPKGAFVPDAGYRIAVCKYAASLYDEVIDDCKAWERDYGNNQQLGEVFSLLADAYAASDREPQAIPIYIQSYKTATTEEVMNYSLFAASKLLQKRGEWNRVADLFTEFIEDKPDNRGVVTALYWIGKAKAREGQVDEAKRITADTIKKYIADPEREPVELLLSQLAQLCAKKQRSEPPVAADGAAAAEATPQIDPGAELDALLGGSETEQRPTARARTLFAKAELARLRRQPAEEEKNIGAIAEKFAPEDLSPVLLGRAGDYLLAHNKQDQARAFYQRLMDEFPKAESIDFAYNGLGEIAFQKNDYNKALRYFSEATEKATATQKLKDVTVGKAKTLLATNKLDDARKVFEQVAAVREWRGESTAFSVYSLGEIEARQGRWAEANAYFQRVYVGYQKFLPWVAKAYLRSAESFEKLGKSQEAANTYRELLRNEKLATFTEADEARKKLVSMGQQYES